MARFLISGSVTRDAKSSVLVPGDSMLFTIALIGNYRKTINWPTFQHEYHAMYPNVNSSYSAKYSLRNYGCDHLPAAWSGRIATTRQDDAKRKGRQNPLVRFPCACGFP